MRHWPFHCLVAFPLLGGCGPSPVPMLSTPATPAAQGSVTAVPDGNGNVRLTIEVKHLARPEAVLPGGKAYVVWVRPPGGQPQNVGALRTDGQLTGRLETATPFPSFELIVTAEELPAVTFPRGPTALEASISGSR